MLHLLVALSWAEVAIAIADFASGCAGADTCLQSASIVPAVSALQGLRLLRGLRIFSNVSPSIPPEARTTVMKSKISSHSVLPGHNSVLCGSLSGLKIDLPQK